MIGTKMEPSVYSDEVIITKEGGVSTEELKRALLAFLSWIADQIDNPSGQLIGHIKCFLSAKNGSGVFASITCATEKPLCKGELKEPIDEAKLLRAAILYGVEKKDIERLMEEGRKRFFDFRTPDLKSSQ